MKKILLVSYYWDQKNSIGRQRWYNLVNELIKEKVKVYVFTASNKNEVVEKGQLVIIRKKIFEIRREYYYDQYFYTLLRNSNKSQIFEF